MSKPQVVTAREIKRQVAELWNLNPEDLDRRSSGRAGIHLWISHARQEAMFRMRHELPNEPSFAWVAQRFGEPHFTAWAAQYACRLHAKRLREGTLMRIVEAAE